MVEAFHGAGLFRLQIPERFGGAGLDPIEALPVYEEVAAADGSAGWNLAIGAGGGSFAAMLDDADALEEIVGPPRALIAGSVNPMALRVGRRPTAIACRGGCVMRAASPRATG